VIGCLGRKLEIVDESDDSILRFGFQSFEEVLETFFHLPSLTPDFDGTTPMVST
jgi:hypothetical protein